MKTNFKAGDIIEYSYRGDTVVRQITDVLPDGTYIWVYPDQPERGFFYSQDGSDPYLVHWKLRDETDHLLSTPANAERLMADACQAFPPIQDEVREDQGPGSLVDVTYKMKVHCNRCNYERQKEDLEIHIEDSPDPGRSQMVIYCRTCKNLVATITSDNVVFKGVMTEEPWKTSALLKVEVHKGIL
jgi:hypothetical protein